MSFSVLDAVLHTITVLRMMFVMANPFHRVNWHRVVFLAALFLFWYKSMWEVFR